VDRPVESSTDRNRIAMRHIATFCGSCSCGCPQLFVNETAAPQRRVVITDDFDQRIEMSLEQLTDLVDAARSGALDEVLVDRV
jgi:hypothetical protein